MNKEEVEKVRRNISLILSKYFTYNRIRGIYEHEGYFLINIHPKALYSKRLQKLSQDLYRHKYWTKDIQIEYDVINEVFKVEIKIEVLGDK